MDTEFYFWLEKNGYLYPHARAIAMNIAAGISAVAELEVSELHCPALGTFYTYKNI